MKYRVATPGPALTVEAATAAEAAEAAASEGLPLQDGWTLVVEEKEDRARAYRVNRLGAPVPGVVLAYPAA